jgi:uncharacterized membrane protein
VADHWLFDELGDTLAERTGLCAAIALSGYTFTRSLMPRTVAGQALATGMTGAVNFGTITATQSALWSGARLALGDLVPSSHELNREQLLTERRHVMRVVAHGINFSAIGVGSLIEASVPQSAGEPLRRAAIRTFGTRLKRAAVAGAATAAILDAVEIGGRAVKLPQRLTRSAFPGVVIATGFAAARIYVKRREAAQFDADLEERQAKTEAEMTEAETPYVKPPLPDPIEKESRRTVAISVGAGVGTAGVLVMIGRGEGLLARLVAHALQPLIPNHSDVRLTVGHLAGLGVLAGGVVLAIDQIYKKTESAGDAVEAAYKDEPNFPYVSGGPRSEVDWATIGREGRRVVNMTLTAAEIEGVMAEPAKEPIRAFVGLESADTPEDRADLMMRELERFGAFERSLICFASPTGTGYLNYVLTEALEYYTRGDCATACIQYSLRPSPLSLDRVRVGRENNIALLTRLKARLDEIPEASRPRLVQFGESLGAHTGQDAYLHQGTGGLHAVGVERALFIGTPEASRWAKSWRLHPLTSDPDGEVAEVASFDEWRALTPLQRAGTHYILLTHHEDPIGKFGVDIAIQKPDWLGPRESRPPGVPPEMDWWPFLTMFVTLADVLNAMNVVPGVFGARGHDYRADLPDFIGAAFDLHASPSQRAAMDYALRARELMWAQRQVVSEQMDKARTKVQQQLETWKVPGSEYLDRVVTLPAHDPMTGVIAQTPAGAGAA